MYSRQEMDALLLVTERLIAKLDEIVVAAVNVVLLNMMVLDDISVNIRGDSMCVRFVEVNARNLLDHTFVRRQGEIPEATPPMFPEAPPAAPLTTPTRDDVASIENDGLVTNLAFYCPNVRIPFGQGTTTAQFDNLLPIEEFSVVNFDDLTINGNFRGKCVFFLAG